MSSVKPPLLVLGGAASVALLAFGCVSAVRRWPDIATGAGLLVGVVCLVLVMFHEQVKGLTLGFSKTGVKIKLDLKAKTSAEFVRTGLAGLGSTYAFVHNQLADDPHSEDVKVRLQDQLVAIAQANAFEKPIGANELKEIIASGSAGERVLAFGLLTSNPKLATLQWLLEGIKNSKSGNEQYHALKAVKASWPQWNSSARRELVAAIRDAPYIQEDRDRQKLAERILELKVDG
jgi:hypothetical protein